jgi:tellurium resistance protein TerD
MAINLEKGSVINLNKCIDLTKKPHTLNKLTVGLGWDVNRRYGGANYDLDAMAAYLDKNGVLTSEKDFIFFGNMKTRGCYLTGDNLTGEVEGDDEQIIVTLKDVPSNVMTISFAVVIYAAADRGQKFGHIDNAFIRVVDNETNQELLRYDLGNQFSSEVGVVVGDLERTASGEWQFKAIGQGLKDVTASSLRRMYASSDSSVAEPYETVTTQPSRTTATAGAPYGNSGLGSATSKKKGFLDKLFGR